MKRQQSAKRVSPLRGTPQNSNVRSEKFDPMSLLPYVGPAMHYGRQAYEYFRPRGPPAPPRKPPVPRRARGKQSKSALDFELAMSRDYKRRQKVRESGPEITYFSGTDFLTAVTAPASAASPGHILIDTSLSPHWKGISSTRLNTVASLFERYVVKSIKIEYRPSAAADSEGSLMGFIDGDPEGDAVSMNIESNLRVAAAHTSSASTRINKARTWTFEGSSKKEYYTRFSSVERMSTPARFYLLAESALAADQVLGDLYITYNYGFSRAAIAPAQYGPGVGFEGSNTAGIADASILGAYSTATVDATSNLAVSWTGNVITLPAGYHLLTVRLEAATPIVISCSATTGTESWQSYGVTGTKGVFSGSFYSTSSYTVTLTGSGMASPSFAALNVSALPVGMLFSRLEDIQIGLNLLSKISIFPTMKREIEKKYLATTSLPPIELERKSVLLSSPTTAASSASASSSVFADYYDGPYPQTAVRRTQPR